MKQLILLFVAFFSLYQISTAQLTSLQNGGDKKATVGERIGLTDVTIHYDRPGVKGREGKIWGALVPYGFTDLGFGTSTASPWRAGANENTTIEFSTDVKINGNDLPAGKYGFSIALGKEESILIFSKNNNSWGSFFYDPKYDALRITVKQQPLDKEVEWLKYEFMNETTNSATIALEWENLMFPFKVEVDNIQTQLASFRNELHSSKGFDYKVWSQAANWCADSNTDLDEGLQWADYAINGRFIGTKDFTTLSAKARILKLMGRVAEADSIMQEAMKLGTVNEVHAYARQLLADKRIKEAGEVFRANYKKFPNVYTTNVGMARCYSSEGNFKEALKYANIALAQAPDMLNKNSVESMIEKLKAGKDVN